MRSLKKGKFFDLSLLTKKTIFPTSGRLKLYCRASAILSDFIGKSAEVYNGKKFNDVEITSLHEGHRFGEFSATRAVFVPKIKTAKKKKAKAKVKVKKQVKKLKLKKKKK